MPETEIRDQFDRIYGALTGLPDVRETRPSRVVDALPIVGNAVSYIVQSMRTEKGALVFLQVVDADGRARMVLPDKVVRTIVRQQETLYDRSTPASRKRA